MTPLRELRKKMPRQLASEKRPVKAKRRAGEVDHFPALGSSFRSVRKLVSQQFPSLKKTQFHLDCPVLKEVHVHRPDHYWRKRGREWRNFMHTGHGGEWNICVHPHAEYEVTIGHQQGLFLHEFGHIIANLLGIESSEENADAVILQYFGIPIEYTELPESQDRHGRGLQYVEIL